MAERPAFVRSLFRGGFADGVVLPFPAPTPEVRETTEEIVVMVRDWAAAAVDPQAIDRTKRIPAEVVEGMAELGLFGLTIPERYGGAGCGQYTYARTMEALSRRCASTVTVLGAHLGIGIKGLLLYGTDEQKERWLPRCATGELKGAFALTEAGAGSDAAALRTVADRTPEGWRLQGRKTWITCGGTAQLITVFARTPAPDRADAALMERPISAFVVPAAVPGVEPGAPEDKLGLCGSNTVEVGLEDVRLPADHLLGPEGQGFKVALNVLNAGRHGLAATCIGQAKLARELALAHARERVQFGRPIAGFGMVQELLAGMEADVYAMEAATWLTALLVDGGRHETMLEAACCKMYATEALWRIANDALQVTGGTGFMREYPYERIVRDARINMIFEGTNQVLRLMLATQGLRSLDDGSPAATLSGVHADLAAEGAVVEEETAHLGAAARATAARFGKEVREAQLPLRRLADRATALFVSAAVLGRASASLAAGTATEHELAVARLACRRLALELARGREEEAAAARGLDGLVEEVARGM